MTQHVGIFGYPLAHSISPVFQQAAFDHYSLPIRYHSWPTPPDKLDAEVRRLRGDEYLGANVTVPHKEQVFDLLDEIDPWAESVGAVNTIVRDQDDLVGYNTDAYGFIRSLKETAGFRLHGSTVLLIGAGGAARAAAFGLAKEGIRHLVIANRTVARGETLAEAVAHTIPHVEAIPLRPQDVARTTPNPDLIVNATSIGMDYDGSQGLSPLTGELIPARALVYDMVYNPPDTPLLKEARKAGAETLGGLWMLIYQGAAAFELWTDEEAPVRVMASAAERALKGLSSAN